MWRARTAGGAVLCLLLNACATGEQVPGEGEKQPLPSFDASSGGGAGTSGMLECTADFDCGGDLLCEDFTCVEPNDDSLDAGTDTGQSDPEQDAGKDAGGSGTLDSGSGDAMMMEVDLSPTTICPMTCANQAAVGCPGFDVPMCELTCQSSYTTCAACNMPLGLVQKCSADIATSAYMCEGAQPVLVPTGCLAEVQGLISCRSTMCPGL